MKKAATAHVFWEFFFKQSSTYLGICLIDGDVEIIKNLKVHTHPSPHPITFKNVMAIKAFCEKLMTITN